MKDAMRREVSSIHPDMLHSAVTGFVTRLECLLPCGGGHVEHILNTETLESVSLCFFLTQFMVVVENRKRVPASLSLPGSDVIPVPALPSPLQRVALPPPPVGAINRGSLTELHLYFSLFSDNFLAQT
ncbi:hypothetical protein TNCV_4307602 [Trichonephila clavipes]|nr:hypothetical protein TNCV_4307602 [Trichonephila clavipes]